MNITWMHQKLISLIKLKREKETSKQLLTNFTNSDLLFASITFLFVICSSNLFKINYSFLNVRLTCMLQKESKLWVVKLRNN
jgi:hypothetical protein